MRFILLVSAAIVAQCFALTARAQIPVTDIGNLQQQIVHYGQMLMDYARQGQQLAQEARFAGARLTDQARTDDSALHV